MKIEKKTWPKYFDIHAHINFKSFKEDGKDVIFRTLEDDIWFINVGSQYSTSKRAVEIAHDYKYGVYACIGLHPIHLEEGHHDEEEVSGPSFDTHAEIYDKEKYLELAKDEKTVAIGECGLDYYHLNEDSIKKQKEVFIKHVELALEVVKPLMLHIRNNPKDEIHNAYLDVADILKQYPLVRGVSHCFGGSIEDMQRFVDLGIYISFAGNITYKHKEGFPNYEEIIKAVPIDKILTDTDSPYLAPVPYRGKRNEPIYVKEIVKKIAEIKGLSIEETARKITENAMLLFKI